MQNYLLKKSNNEVTSIMMNMFFHKIRKAADMGLDIVLPPRCPVSGDLVDAHGVFSASLWQELDFIAAPFCGCCGIPFDFDITAHEGQCMNCLQKPPLFDRARAALVYNEGSRRIILGFKHGDKTHMVHGFTPWLKRAGAEILNEADFLIPVPLHHMRLIARKYNQAGLIADALVMETGVKHLPLALKRVRATPSQGHLKSDERAKNVRRAFTVRKQYDSVLIGKNVVLIDDVYTTGATVNECTKVLKRAGVSRVDILTLARVVKD